MPASETLLKAIAVTAELTGTEISKTAARVMADDLSQYPEPQVLSALTKCRRELRGRMSIADVVSRIDDGRPGPDEAWAMIPHDESGSVVWTDEMAESFGIACRLIECGDTIQARMAFLETYKARCQQSRDLRLPVKWVPSLGHDPAGRESVLLEAAEKGRLSVTHAQSLLPYRDGSDAKAHLEMLLVEANSRALSDDKTVCKAIRSQALDAPGAPRGDFNGRLGGLFVNAANKRTNATAGSPVTIDATAGDPGTLK